MNQIYSIIGLDALMHVRCGKYKYANAVEKASAKLTHQNQKSSCHICSPSTQAESMYGNKIDTISPVIIQLPAMTRI